MGKNPRTVDEGKDPATWDTKAAGSFEGLSEISCGHFGFFARAWVRVRTQDMKWVRTPWELGSKMAAKDGGGTF